MNKNNNVVIPGGSFGRRLGLNRPPKNIGTHMLLIKHFIDNRAVFSWVSKVIRVRFGFTLLPLLIDSKDSRYFLIQLEVKLKPIAHF